MCHRLRWVAVVALLLRCESVVAKKKLQARRDLPPPRQMLIPDQSSSSHDESYAAYSEHFGLHDGVSLGKRLKRLRLPAKDDIHATLETATAKARVLLREIKGSRSSEFECAVIKGTRPDSAPAKEKHVARLVETISTFPLASGRSNKDYFRMHLHKLWSRMAEKDWRTVAKALYILHRSAVSLDPQLHSVFFERYKTLRKLVHAGSRSRYFSTAALLDVQDEGYVPFLRSYSAFVFERFILFSGRFEERFAKPERQALPPERLVALLRNARRVLERAIAIDCASPAEAHALVLQCTELVSTS